ncbi:O-antigen ligase family protein [Lacrimispora sp.]|jgi:hypothetical protein|uniref:O-antigen ligase family protein n=1 Tax=Lacrimispora sp. TaxID=2719234 RepID=UPI0028A838A4|nr:O-antigen ligase family protein [Lacrimispora sp.]
MLENSRKDIEKGVLQKNKLMTIGNIIAFFTVLLLTIFPLYYHNYYFDILVVKYKLFYMTVILMAIILLLIFIINRNGDMRKQIKAIYYSKFNLADKGMISFCIIAIISTLQSSYKFESLWGNEGRYSGLFLLLIYGLAFFIISKGIHYSKWLIELFLFSSMLVCVFGITDYFMLDILGFKKNIDANQYNMFASTIGNINTYTAYVGMVMGVSTVLFVSAKTLPKIIWYFACMIISFFAIIMGLSDNAYLAIGALFAFLPLWLFKNRIGVKRYIFVLTTFIYVIYTIDFVNKIIPSHVLQMGGILEKLSGYSRLEYIVIVATIICCIVYLFDFISKGKCEYGIKLQIAWAILLVVLFMGGLYVLYDANIVGSEERYGALGNYLVFNDEWGTHRGYIWRMGLECYEKQPLIHKLFGYGPDTFGIMAMSSGRYSEMTTKYNEYFDSAHNEYLQYFITMGPFGLISYILFLVGSGIRMIKSAIKDSYVMAVFFAMICYAVQAVVNISLPITTPVFIVLIAVGLAGCRNVVSEG